MISRDKTSEELLTEIEHLRGENLKLQVAVLGPDSIRAHQAGIIEKQAARIAELEKWECEFPCSEERWCTRQNLCNRMKNLDSTVANQAARIKKLEDALAEYQRLGKIMEGRLPCLTLHGECERCSSRVKELCDAMHQIAEGKIGPDVKPRSWKITDERIRFLTEIATIIDEAGFVAKSACIRAMLKEADQK